MKTYSDIQTDILVKLNASSTQAFYTDAIIGAWTQQATHWANGFKKWPFTEGRVTTTYVADSTEEVGFTYPEGWRADSIRLLQVGGKRFRKTNFFKYQEYREDNANDQTKIFSDFGLTYYINPNADVSGTTTLWGQYTPVTLDITDLTATTLFSTNAEEGNEAIVEKVLSFAKMREKKMQEVLLHEQRAQQILNDLLKKINDEQFGYQDTQGDGMFKRFDVVQGDFNDSIIRRNQWF